jgi:hypothetical protein
VVHGVFAPGTVLQGQSLIVGLAESEDLEDLNFLTPPASIANVYLDGDPRPGLDELGGLEPPPTFVMLLQEVDHLLAVASGWRLAFPAAPRDT